MKRMSGTILLCFFILWTSSLALKKNVYVQTPTGFLLCSETYHRTGICKSLMFDIKHMSCALKKSKSEPLTGHESILAFKKVSMRVSSYVESVNICRQRGQNGTSNETDWNSFTKELKISMETLNTKETETVQYTRNISLHQACEEDKLDAVKYILSQGLEDINCQGKLGRTPVMVAARKGHLRVFDYLVSKSCDLSAVDGHSNNVLHVACIGGNADIVRKLIMDHNCDIESKGIYGRTPVMLAACYDHVEVFDLLVGLGCKLTAMDDQKDNILHMSCYYGCINIVKSILSQGLVSIESRGQKGRTPVMHAVWGGQIAIFDLLHTANCRMTAMDNQRNNILHIACIGGHVEIVRYLMTLRDVKWMARRRNGYGETIIQVARRQRRREVIRLLRGKKME